MPKIASADIERVNQALTRTFRKHIETWCGTHGDERIPLLFEPLDFLLTKEESNEYKRHMFVNKRHMAYPGTYSITVNTIVWPVVVQLDMHHNELCIVEAIGKTFETVGKMWNLEASDEVYDFGKYKFIRFKTPAKRSKDAHLVAGFFVRDEDLYNTAGRTNEIARTGKQISQTVEVESASSKKGKKWEVMIYTDGTASCNCPSWIYQAHPLGKECKHTTKVLNDISKSKGTP